MEKDGYEKGEFKAVAGAERRLGDKASPALSEMAVTGSVVGDSYAQDLTHEHQQRRKLSYRE